MQRKNTVIIQLPKTSSMMLILNCNKRMIANSLKNGNEINRKQLKNTNSKKLAYRTLNTMTTDIVIPKKKNYN